MTNEVKRKWPRAVAAVGCITSRLGSQQSVFGNIAYDANRFAKTLVLRAD